MQPIYKPYCPYENAVFEAVACYPEYVPDGVEEQDLWFVGGELLAGGNCGAFVYLYGRALALRVRESAQYIGNAWWLATMKDAIVRGYSLHDSQGSAGGISCPMMAAWE